jgi:hypothetical protein
MQFSQREIKLIEKLRKQERQWPWTRWVVLAMGALSMIEVALGGYFLSLALTGSGADHPDSGEVLVIALVVTKGILMFLFAIWCFVVAFRDWHGNVRQLLFLKLLDAQEKETNIDVRGG